VLRESFHDFHAAGTDARIADSAIPRSGTFLFVLMGICTYAPSRMSFAPAGAGEDFDAKRIPRLMPWAKFFRPSGPERATRNICASQWKSQRQKLPLRQPSGPAENSRQKAADRRMKGEG
jgi:hypothetical protein